MVLRGFELACVCTNAITRIFAHELKDTNVLVNSVDPGWVRTHTKDATKSIEEGVEHTIWLAKISRMEVLQVSSFETSGRYLGDLPAVPPQAQAPSQPLGAVSEKAPLVAAETTDREKKIWEYSAHE